MHRIRLEWAASILVARPQADVLEVALDAGFRSASGFARAFKERFGMSATQWRKGGAEAWSKDRQALRKFRQPESKAGKAADAAREHGSSRRGDGSPTTTEEDTMNVTVKTLPSQPVAYMRHVGPYGGKGIGELWQKLMRWASARDLWTADRVCVGISYDDPRVTDPDKCRYDAGIVVPAGFKADAQVNLSEIRRRQIRRRRLRRERAGDWPLLGPPVLRLAPRQRLPAGRRPLRRGLPGRSRGLEDGSLPLRALPASQAALTCDRPAGGG